MPTRRSWQEELEIIDRTMKAVSRAADPEMMVEVYWDGIGDLLPGDDYLALSRRGIDPPGYIITRSSRFKEHPNPWKEREKLPHLQGGLLGEIAYADAPVVIDDLPALLKPDDPAYFYLEGFGSLIASPQYDNGKGLNIGLSLFPPGVQVDRSIIPMMHWQAGLFGRATHSMVLRNQLSEALQRIDREMQTVGMIQRSLLPKELPVLPGFELAAYYQTSARAGGDYYDFFPLESDGCGLFIADVAGHGTPAAVLMAITHAIAHTRPGGQKPPHEVLAHLNRHLTRSYTRSSTFVTAFYATLDPRSRRLIYSTAGHNPPRLLRGDRVLPLDACGSLPLGIIEDETFGEATISLQPGDLLLLYTDGITESFAPAPAGKPRDLYGVKRLDELLRTCNTCSPEQCIEKIRASVNEFTNNAAPADDQTLIAMKCLS